MAPVGAVSLDDSPASVSVYSLLYTDLAVAYGYGDAVNSLGFDDPVSGELAAIQNDRFSSSGNPVQGPLVNLFQLEMTAKQLCPEQFDERPEYETGPYPEIPEDEQLFDRDRLANAINGTFA